MPIGRKTPKDLGGVSADENVVICVKASKLCLFGEILTRGENPTRVVNALVPKKTTWPVKKQWLIAQSTPGCSAGSYDRSRVPEALLANSTVERGDR